MFILISFKVRSLNVPFQYLSFSFKKNTSFVFTYVPGNWRFMLKLVIFLFLNLELHVRSCGHLHTCKLQSCVYIQ